MKNVWKRTLSLMLSGVLLLGSVPMGAFATEQTQEPTELVEEIQPTAETQPVVAVVKDEVANAGGSALPVKVDGDIDDAWLLDAYNKELNRLTLDGKNLSSVECTEENSVLVIELKADTTIEGTLSAQKGIQITGEGILTVGNIDAGENLEIVDAVVKVGTDKGESEDQKTLITVKNEIRVSGEAHLLTAVGHKAVAFTDEAEGAIAKIQGEGYYRTAQSGDFAEILSDTTVDMDLEYFEVVGASHVEDAGEHVTSCKCAEDTKVTLILGNHTPEYSFEEGSNEITAKCGDIDCNRDLEPVKITVPADLTWNGKEKAVSVNADDFNVHYEVIGGEDETSTVLEENQKPVDPGTYRAIATITLNGTDYTLIKEFTVQPVDITKLTVKLDKDSAPFQGVGMNVPRPTVTVKNGETLVEETENYTVSYYRGTSKTDDFASVGNITVRVTGINNYTGTVDKTFSITKATPEASMFNFKAPVVPEESVLTYDGTAKAATVTTKGGIAGMGQITMKYYKNNTMVEEPIIDAGTYTVKISVDEGANYAATTQELTDPDWAFTIAKSSDYTNDLATDSKQIIIKGSGEFIEPTFTGVKRANSDAADKLTRENGSLVYKRNNSQIALSELKNLLAGLSHDATEKIDYTFTPDEDSNYTGETKGSISFTVAEMTFHMEGKDSFQASDLVKNGDIIYGDADIIDTSKLSAKSNGVKIEGVKFTVEYESAQQRISGRKQNPDIGLNKFYVIASGELEGSVFKTEVCRGEITVKGKKIQFTKPTEKLLTVAKNEDDTPKEFELMDAIQVADPTTGAEIKYNLDGQTPKTDIPKASAIGRYKVNYQISAPNYETESGFVWATIQPELTAVYGDKLSQVKGVPSDGKWVWALNDAALDTAKLNEHSVGHYGENKTFQMIYNGQGSAFTVAIKVGAKSITPTVEDVPAYVLYKDKDEIIFKVKDPDGEKIISSDEYKYELTEAETKTGEAIITIKDNKSDGDYEIAEVNQKTVLYKPRHMSFSDSLFPPDLKETDYDTAAKVKTELSSKVEADDYPADNMKYFNIMMDSWSRASNGDMAWLGTRKEEYYPIDGFDIVIPYDALGVKPDEHDFKVSLMDAADHSKVGTEAGKNVKVVEAVETDEGLKFHADGCSVACIAVNVDRAKPYNITTSVIYDGKTSTKGSLTIEVDSKSSTTATYDKTVTVKAKANSGYSIESVKVTKSGEEEVKTTQSGTTYTFKMPASDVKVKLTLKKTASTTKNPYSGDSSNIYLWVVILAASGAAIGALMAFWFKKRKK